MEVLAEVATSIESHPSPAVLFPAVFHFMERLDACDLGSPGPLVHALEAVGGYVPELSASVVRKPTFLTLWMLNRILNAANAENRGQLLQLLALSVEHPKASSQARSAAAQFLHRQNVQG